MSNEASVPELRVDLLPALKVMKEATEEVLTLFLHISKCLDEALEFGSAEDKVALGTGDAWVALQASDKMIGLVSALRATNRDLCALVGDASELDTD